MVLRGLSIYSQKISRISDPSLTRKTYSGNVFLPSQNAKTLMCKLKRSHDLGAVDLHPIIQQNESQ